MEVIGAIASIVQLAGTAAQLSRKLYEICDTFGSAAEELRLLSLELSFFGEALGQLSVLLREDQSLYTNSVYFTIAMTIESCGDAYSQIDTIITRFYGKAASMNQDANSMSIASRFMWTLQQRKINLLYTRLQAMKLNLLVNIQLMHISLT